MPIVGDTPKTPPVQKPVPVQVTAPAYQGATVEIIKAVAKMDDIDTQHPIVIYLADNEETGEYYIGATVNKSRRKNEHLSELRRGDHHNQKFQDAFDRNPNFQWAEIPIITCEDAFDLERALIKATRSDPKCLNLRDAVPVSQATRDKHREYQTGRVMSEEARLNISLAKKAQWQDPEYVDKQKTARVGRTLSDEHKANIRATSIFTQNSKPVRINGVEYSSVMDAAKDLELSHSTVRKRLSSTNFTEWNRL